MQSVVAFIGIVCFGAIWWGGGNLSCSTYMSAMHSSTLWANVHARVVGQIFNARLSVLPFSLFYMSRGMGPTLCFQSSTVSFGYELQAGLAETSVLNNFWQMLITSVCTVYMFYI